MRSEVWTMSSAASVWWTARYRTRTSSVDRIWRRCRTCPRSHGGLLQLGCIKPPSWRSTDESSMTRFSTTLQAWRLDPTVRRRRFTERFDEDENYENQKLRSTNPNQTQQLQRRRCFQHQLVESLRLVLINIRYKLKKRRMKEMLTMNSATKNLTGQVNKANNTSYANWITRLVMIFTQELKPTISF